MTGPEHFRRAEELAAEAQKLLGQGDGQATAGVWAAVAQTHAVLALAAATAVGTSSLDSRAWADVAGPGSKPARILRVVCASRRRATGKWVRGKTSPAGQGCDA